MALCFKRPLWFGALAFLALFLVLMLGQKASATSITLDSSDTELCEVQVTIGPEAPKGPIHRFADIDSDDRYTFETSKLCNRRTVGGEACTDEYTEWTCCEAQEGEDITCRVP
ncbi:hypothetical protein PsAD2_02031 [Pseudovibrio axinellae]|uniref:Uncharacterized protein n=1 Tax=Pseudovibrio axinellae TaxID=989403 RepID=A0A165YVT8_9HYPH|nr:hypothetical protein [Pseudovibrio axinellae]KZL19280.1 hypothetical protein PsAD2_02031 [Pseudovibrio axinellae]SEQ43067.1 hypothetical protein SAMN05421798_102676 [Pseudovibrio axinellae]